MLMLNKGLAFIYSNTYVFINIHMNTYKQTGNCISKKKLNKIVYNKKKCQKGLKGFKPTKRKNCAKN